MLVSSARRGSARARSSFCCSWDSRRSRGTVWSAPWRGEPNGCSTVYVGDGRRTVDLPERVLEERDRVRQALGARWPWAVVAVVSKWAFDYFALVAAVAASGARVESIPLMFAYLAASVLKMIPITPGGLGFVEAGLAVTLVWAGLSAANATLATLAYRLVSYWLPLIAGVAAAVVYRHRYPARAGSLA